MKENLSNLRNKLSAFRLLPSALRFKASGAAFDLVGRTATVERRLAPEGAILVCGEMWRACMRSGENVARGARVRVVGAYGHLLEVARIESDTEI